MFDLQQGDCLELMKRIPDKFVDLILCDLPYGTTSCKWDAVIPFGALWEQYRRIAKDTAPIVLTANQPFSSRLVNSNIEEYRYSWIWRKTRPSNQTMAKAQPLRVHEDVLVFGKRSAHNMAKERMSYNPQGLGYVGRTVKQSSVVTDNLGAGRTRAAEYFQEWTNYPKTVIDIPSEGKTVHPTQKPVALMEYLVKTYTNEGDKVLDNCMGSGTTGVACANTGRHFIGMEMDEKYFSIASERIEIALCGDLV